MKKIISRELIDAWNRLAEASRGTDNWLMFSLVHEWLNGKKWVTFYNRSTIRGSYIKSDTEEFYIKTIKGETFIYWENRTEKERWYLNDTAKAFFNVIESEG